MSETKDKPDKGEDKGNGLYRVLVQLQPFASAEEANQAADSIREAGNISYTDASDATVNLTVGDVTVDYA